MDILNITYPLSVVLIFAAALGCGYFISKKFRLNWLLFWIGGAVFILSQVFHIPFNYFVLPALARWGVLPAPTGTWAVPFQALVLGLSAGLFEESARFFMFRFWAKDARSWGKGLMAGAGHGGMEAMILGIIVLYTFFQLFALRGADLSLIIPADRLPLVESQVAEYWSVTWYASLLPFWERAFTIPVHIALSVIVLQVFLRRQVRWLFFAIAFHTILNALAVYSAYTWGIYAAEGIIALLGLTAIGIIFSLRSPEPQEESGAAPDPPSQPPVFIPPHISDSDDKLVDSRYWGE
jgi:uncharacterized membrane protein YhfC